MPSITRHFPGSYGEARKKFLDACKEAGATVETIQNTHANGPRGEPLYVDVARIGPSCDEGGRKLFICNSATHGVEGFCGSGCQTGYLREDLYETLPQDGTLVLVHSLNPYGFAHVRRVNEDNVDLNRNFVDHGAAYPDDSAYREIHDLLVPDTYDEARAAADAKIDAFIAERGQFAFQAAVTGGQYSRADGLFYGGNGPTWSNHTWRDIITRYAKGYDRIAFIDFHTGLGPYGFGELIVINPDPVIFERAKAWYGEEGVTSIAAGTSTSAEVRGDISTPFGEICSESEITPVALEYGTRDVRTVLEALRADNWLYLHGDVDSAQGQKIKAQIRDALYPDTDDWKEVIWERAREVYEKAWVGLQS